MRSRTVHTMLRTGAVLATAVVFCWPARAQNITDLDGLSIPVAAVGSPAGSYPLSGFETVNLYNGILNANVPILRIGGRGDAGYTMSVPIQQGWTVSVNWNPNPGILPPVYTVYQNYNAIDPYGPGIIQVQSQWDGAGDNCSNNNYADNTLTTLAFVLPDGTTTNLVDQKSGGAIAGAGCQGYSRGTVFQSRDGSDLTFVADSPLSDSIITGTPAQLGPGTLIFKNGVRYRFEYGTTQDFGSTILLAWISDRNGNQITFNYANPDTNGGTTCQNALSGWSFDGNGWISQIVDDLNRVVTICRSQSQDVIVYQGAGGAQRLIKINKPAMTSTEDLYQLFGAYSGYTLADHQAGTVPYPAAGTVGSIILPNSEQYTFQYDAFGEVSQVSLPTGGEFQYTWANMVSSGPVIQPGGTQAAPLVVRYVQYRDVYNVYPVGATPTLQEHTVYTLNSSSTSLGGQNLPTVVTTVDHYADEAGTVGLAHEVHSFYGYGVWGSSWTAEDWYPAWLDGKEYQTVEKTADGSATLRSTSQTWTQQAPSNGAAACPSGEVCLGTSAPFASSPSTLATASPANPVMIGSTTTLDTGAVSSEEYTYDQYANRTSTAEYDYGGSLLRYTQTTYLTGNGYDTITSTSAIATHLPSLVQEKSVCTSATSCSASTAVADTQYCYDQQSGGNCVTAPALTNPNPVGWTNPNNSQRGNVTTIARLISGGSYAQNSAVYDVTGNVTSITDAKSNVTNYSYSDSFSTGSLLNNSTVLNAFTFVPPCVSGCVSDGFLTGITNPLSQKQSATYDYYIGKPTSVTDVTNGTTTTYTFNDPNYLDRLTNVTYPDNGSVTYTYLDSSNTVSTQTLLTSGSDSCGANLSQNSAAIYDGLGRTTLAITTEPYNGSTIQAAVQTTYDGLGRVYQVSNPYVYPGSPSYQTTATYDGINRVSKVTDQDGSYRTTSYSVSSAGYELATMTDEAGKKKTNTTDAAGRVNTVVEDPSGLAYTTGYQYNVLDDLLGVSQSGQSRTFAYDGLKRLICASNSESSSNSCTGTMLPTTGLDRYSYDANGNLVSHTDANASATNYLFDALNRVIRKTYTDGAGATTPTDYFCYDGSTSAISVPGGTPVTCSGAPTTPGSYSARRLTWESNANSTNSFTGFDPMGRVVSHSQITGGVTYPFTYAYNLAGGLESEGYPSGRKVSTCYDVAGRVSQVSRSNPGNTATYASGISYQLDGQMLSTALGNGLTETRGYSQDRLQLTSNQTAAPGATPLLGLQFSYVNATGNNGNLQTQTITALESVPNHGQEQVTNIQSYTYDTVNRLAGVSETQPQLPTGDTAHPWSINFSYDIYGNQWASSVTSSLVGAPVATASNPYSGSNNRLSSGDTYYSAGQLKTDPNLGTITYYAGGQQYTMVDGGNTATYYYDPAGQRTEKVLSGVTAGTVTYVYDAAGQVTAEYSTIPNTDVGTEYLMDDQLGSTRLMTGNSGNCLNQWDYFPFGGQMSSVLANGNREDQCASSSGLTIKFTGKERDAETGLDYFGARYFSSAQGRFTSPDLPFADQRPEDPQSWNLYTYGRNNPLRYTDPTGHCTADGEQHGWLWCAAHSIGLTQTVKEQADDARQSLSQMHGFTINGQAPGAIAKSGTNQQVIAAQRSAFNFIASEGMRLCAPGVMCGVILPIGPVAGVEASAAEAGAVEGVEAGAQSEYTNITRAGSVTNISTNVTAQEFGQNLEASGFTKSLARDGTPIYTKGSTQYTVYPKATSTGGPTAQVKVNGVVVEKIRLK